MKPQLFALLLFLTSQCYSQVIINEIQSSNSSIITDNYGEYEDWIEIYNPNNFQVDIGGLVLKDNVDTWQIPLGDSNTIISPNGYFILWADDEEIQGKFHTNFKLSASNGEFLGLYESDSVSEIESVNIPPLSGDESYGKCTDNNWTKLNTPTPLANNNCSESSTYNSENKSILIYPTISGGNIHIDMQDKACSTITLHLLSTNGKLVLSENYSDQEFSINLHHLPNDIYIVKIDTENDSFHNKIVLAK